MFARLLAEAVPRTEDASGAAGGGFHAPGAPENASRTTGGCPQSVESAVLRASDASRTTEGCFWHRIFILYRKSLFFTPNASENASRTIGACFLHRVSLPYHRRAFPVPSPQRQVAAAAELRTYKERGRPFSRPLVVLYRHEPRVWNAAQAVELRNRFEIILLQPEL